MIKLYTSEVDALKKLLDIAKVASDEIGVCISCGLEWTYHSKRGSSHELDCALVEAWMILYPKKATVETVKV